MNRNVRKYTFGHVRACEDSDQPAHSRSLIRIFTRRILDSQGCQASSCGQRRFWSDCENAQADLSHRLAHMSNGTFSNDADNTVFSLQSAEMVGLSIRNRDTVNMKERQRVNAVFHVSFNGCWSIYNVCFLYCPFCDSLQISESRITYTRFFTPSCFSYWIFSTKTVLGPH